jgi:hypothetical protein
MTRMKGMLLAGAGLALLSTLMTQVSTGVAIAREVSSMLVINSVDEPVPVAVQRGLIGIDSDRNEVTLARVQAFQETGLFNATDSSLGASVEIPVPPGKRLVASGVNLSVVAPVGQTVVCHVQLTNGLNLAIPLSNQGTFGVTIDRYAAAQPIEFYATEPLLVTCERFPGDGVLRAQATVVGRLEEAQ